MSKFGNTILDIQELYNMGIPDEAISKQTKTSIEFVRQIIKNMSDWDGPQYSNESHPEDYSQ